MRFYIVLGLTIEKYCQRNKLERMFFVIRANLVFRMLPVILLSFGLLLFVKIVIFVLHFDKYSSLKFSILIPDKSPTMVTFCTNAPQVIISHSPLYLNINGRSFLPTHEATQAYNGTLAITLTFGVLLSANFNPGFVLQLSKLFPLYLKENLL